MADWQQLIQLGQQMQGRLSDLQTELARRTIDVVAGGGAVRVQVDGRGRVRNLSIDAAAFEGRDADLLSDLVLAAVAEAQRRADDMAQVEATRVPPDQPSAS
ncbi:MAG: YbaB/EbfC family nucleoid-associated protein [Gemmatimonadales bacterium]